MRGNTLYCVATIEKLKAEFEANNRVDDAVELRKVLLLLLRQEELLTEYYSRITELEVLDNQNQMIISTQYKKIERLQKEVDSIKEVLYDSI